MPLSTFLWWFLLLWLGGWAFLPVAGRLTAAPVTPQNPVSVMGDATDRGMEAAPQSEATPLADGGLALGRVLFLSLWTMAAFWAGNAGLATQLGAWFAVPLMSLGGWFWLTQTGEILESLGRRLSATLTSDALFLLIFLLFFLLRGFWSDTAGNNGEKPMDASLIAALVRAPHLPPPNPYAAGSSLQSYYYFGHLETALLTCAVGTETRWSYNLMAATLPALCFPLLFALGASLSPGRRPRDDAPPEETQRVVPQTTPPATLPPAPAATPALELGRGLILSGIVLFLGTLEPLRQWLTAIGTPGPHRLDFFSTSRVLPYAINEYPWFTFNEADLHAHYFGLCSQLAILTLALCIYRGSRIAMWTATVLLGAQIITNTWDFPAYVLLVGLAVLLAPAAESSPPRSVPRRLTAGCAIAIAACLLASPYLLHLKTAATPPRWLPQPASPSALWFLLWGPNVLAWLLSLYVLSDGKARLRLRAIALAALGMSSLVALVTGQDFGVLIALPAIMAVGLVAAPCLKPAARFWLLPGLCGLLALLWSETTWAGFLGDPAQPRIEDFVRQDTVFKFGLQAWILWGSASVALALISWPLWPRGPRWLVLPLGLVMLTSTAIVTQGRCRNFGVWDAWDGWAHLAPPERAAATWLRSHTPASENLLEAFDVKGGDYTAFGRFAAATGIPTIMGPQAHTFQWAPAHSGDVGREWDEVGRRRLAVEMIYRGKSAATRKSLLNQFHVRYIVLGDLETQAYGTENLLRLRHELPIAYEFGANADPKRVTLLLNPG